MKYKLYLIIILLHSALFTYGKTGPSGVSHVLDDLFTRIMSTGNDNERIRLNDSIRLIISDYVRSDSVFTHRFDNVRNLGQILSPDRQVKIINWNLILRDNNNRYFCYIIRKAGKNEPNKVYALTGAFRKEPAKDNIVYNENDWYGALYYAIQPFKKGKTTDYVILGIDYGNMLVTRKIIDVLSFAGDGGLVFGLDCFKRDDKTKVREVFEYSSDNVMTLRIHSGKLIVFDHLVSFSETKNDNPQYYGSEYTYDAYALKKGSWIFTSNVEMRNKKKN